MAAIIKATSLCGSLTNAAGTALLAPTIVESPNNTDTDYRLIITDKNGSFTTPNLMGQGGGSGGGTGQDGFSPIIEVTAIDDGYTLTITDKKGTKTVTIKNGAPGVTFTPHVSNEGMLSWTNDGNLDNPAPVSLKGPIGDTGPQGEPGVTPVKGTDYWTAADKQEVVHETLISIPLATTEAAGKVKPDGTTITVDADGTIHSIGGGTGGASNADQVSYNDTKTQLGVTTVQGAIEHLAEAGGTKGDDGATFTPSVSSEGVISWTNDKNLDNPTPVNIKGPKGDIGPQGETGEKGATGAAFTYNMFTEEQLAGLKGPKGDAGEKGATGAQGPIGPVGPQGETGPAGPQGPQGVQGEKGATGETGPQGATGPQGPKGDDTVWLGDTEPSEEYNVWIDPNGTTADQLVTMKDLENFKGEPDEYIKSATVDGNKLTLTKKDNTTVDFEPSGGGGTANADEATIITNTEGKLETAIGGKYVDGLVDGPTIATVQGTGQDVSNYITYNVMKQLIAKGDRLRANINHASYGEQKGCTVTIDTSEESQGIYKLTCNYVTNNNTETYIGNTNSSTTGVWTCTRKSQYGRQEWKNKGNNFYSIENGKIASPFNVDFIPMGDYFYNVAGKLTPTYYTVKNDSYVFSHKPTRVVGNRNIIFGDKEVLGSNNFVIEGTTSGANCFLDCGNYSGTNSNCVAFGNLNASKGNYNYLFGLYHNWWDKTGTVEKAVMFGEGNLVNSNHCFVEGKYCLKDTNAEYAHIVGNGTSGTSRSNAYTLDWQGNGTFAGTVSSSTGADYAEYFEWKDGNPANEDRVGYIVTLDGDKIVKANSGDDILGICSGTAMVLGDSAEWNWNKRYLTDDFGRIIYEDRMEHHEAIYNPDGELIEEAWDEEVHAPKQNPDYDPSQPYIKRENRPEWQIVGMMGKLYVRDDGSCVVNGYADVANGIATKATGKTNMRVMERVNDSIIRVLMK